MESLGQEVSLVATSLTAYADQVGQSRLIWRVSEASNSEAAANRNASWARVPGDGNKLAGSRALSSLRVSAPAESGGECESPSALQD